MEAQHETFHWQGSNLHISCRVVRETYWSEMLPVYDHYCADTVCTKRWLHVLYSVNNNGEHGKKVLWPENNTENLVKSIEQCGQLVVCSEHGAECSPVLQRRDPRHLLHTWGRLTDIYWVRESGMGPCASCNLENIELIINPWFDLHTVCPDRSHSWCTCNNF